MIHSFFVVSNALAGFSGFLLFAWDNGRHGQFLPCKISPA